MAKAQKNSDPAQRIVPIRTPTIELAQFVKFAGLTESGGQAKQLIADGEVSVNGVVETRKGRQLAVGDRVTVGVETLLLAAE